jgi:hypothetical protein
VCQALEANQAGEAGYAHRSAAKLDRFRAFGNGVVVQRWKPSPHDVDDSVAAVDTQMMRTRDILGRERLAVAEPPAIYSLQKAQHSTVSVRTVWHEQVAVLGCTNMPMSYHRETTNNHVFEPDRLGVGNDAR